MLDELYYYLMLPLTVGALGFGFYFIIEPDKTKAMLTNWSWQASKAYITVQGWGDGIASYLENSDTGSSSDEDSDDDEEEENKRQVVMFDDKDRNNYIGTIPESTDECKDMIKKINPSLMFIKTTVNDIDYFKRTTDPCLSDTNYLTFTDKPFVQVEYIVDDKTVLDIHENLTGFYVNGNKILDEAFLNWYLYYFYSKPLDSDYTLRIFDKDVNMFVIKKDQYIQLDNNEYTVQPGERGVQGPSEDYEGAEDAE